MLQLRTTVLRGGFLLQKQSGLEGQLPQVADQVVFLLLT
jgi:hypothetical protein